MYRPLFLTALVIGALTQPLRAQIIQNGSFEAPSEPGIAGLPNLVVETGTLIPNWTVTSGAVTLINPGTVSQITGLLAADNGAQYVVLDQLSVSLGAIAGASAPGTISQTFTTTPGDAYTIKYAYAGIGLSVAGATSTLGVNVSGYNPYSSTNGLLNVSLGGFQTTSFNFTATGTTSVLTFNETANDIANGGGIGLDSVSALDLGPAPVPEPAQSALLGMGFLVALAALRHHRRGNKPALVPAGSLA